MTKPPETFEVDAVDAGTRLDVWLSARLGISRSQIQHRTKRDQIEVNGKPATAHYPLKAGDSVVCKPASVESALRTVKAEKLLPTIEVLEETADYIVINKPAGLLMHQASEQSDEPTVVDWLLERFPAARKVGEDPLRPGIVHRLDREASGLVVLSKTQAMFDHLKEQFQKRTINKRYTALVYGGDMPGHGDINFKIERSTQGGKMAARPTSQEGKTAVTEFSVLTQYHNYSLLSVVIKTGRTHQIRVHMAAYNHPIVGDDIYGQGKHRLTNKKFSLGRIFLAATELGFTDLNDQPREFSIPLPTELQEFLKKVK